VVAEASRSSPPCNVPCELSVERFKDRNR
jgi:hypothetical protein